GGAAPEPGGDLRGAGDQRPAGGAAGVGERPHQPGLARFGGRPWRLVSVTRPDRAGPAGRPPCEPDARPADGSVRRVDGRGRGGGGGAAQRGGPGGGREGGRGGVGSAGVRVVDAGAAAEVEQGEAAAGGPADDRPRAGGGVVQRLGRERRADPGAAVPAGRPL